MPEIGTFGNLTPCELTGFIFGLAAGLFGLGALAAHLLAVAD